MPRIFSGWIWKSLEWHKIWSLHRLGTIDHLGSIHFSYNWLCNWKQPFLAWPKGESPGALYVGQALPWKVAPTRCGTMWFLCALVAQLVDQFYTTFNFAIGSKIHNQRSQLIVFSHNEWSKLLPTRQEKPPWFPMNTIGKPKSVSPTFVSFPRTHAF
jgi:hypothetical protein